jgi:hypothetical protein
MANNSECREQVEPRNGKCRQTTRRIITAADYLHERGRTVMFWGEYPLNRKTYCHCLNTSSTGGLRTGFRPGIQSPRHSPDDLHLNPGVEPLFPDYYTLPSSRLHPANQDRSRSEMAESISFGSSRRCRSDGSFCRRLGRRRSTSRNLLLGYVTGGLRLAPGPQSSRADEFFYFLTRPCRESGQVVSIMDKPSFGKIVGRDALNCSQAPW